VSESNYSYVVMDDQGEVVGCHTRKYRVTAVVEQLIRAGRSFRVFRFWNAVDRTEITTEYIPVPQTDTAR